MRPDRFIRYLDRATGGKGKEFYHAIKTLWDESQRVFNGTNGKEEKQKAKEQFLRSKELSTLLKKTIKGARWDMVYKYGKYAAIAGVFCRGIVYGVATEPFTDWWVEIVYTLPITVTWESWKKALQFKRTYTIKKTVRKLIENDAF